MIERARAVTLFLLMTCQSTQALALGGIALMLPLIRQDLGLSFAEAGTLSAASGLTYALLQIPSGALADRIGPKWLFIAGVIGANVMTFTFTLVQSYPLLIANQALSGACRALIFAPGLLLFQAQFDSNRRATASGVFIVGGLTFNMLLSLFGPMLIGPLGWRGLLMVCAVGIIAAAVSYAWIGAAPPRGRGLPLQLSELPELIRKPTVQWAGAVQFVRHAAVNGWNFWLPTLLVTEKGMSLAAAGVLVALSTAVTVPANFFGGHVSDHLQRPIGVICASFLMLAVGFLLLVPATGMVAISAVVVLVGIFIQFSFGPIFAYPIRVIGQRSAGFVSGFTNMCANLGGLCAAYGLGLLKDGTGTFASGLAALAVLCLLGTGAALMLARSGHAELSLRGPHDGVDAPKPIAGTSR